MSFRKIDDDTAWRVVRCRHREHKPPSMIVLLPGIWEWSCPGCGAKTVVYVKDSTCSAKGTWERLP